ncbi:MAG: VOC family protein [Pseudolabrys sp.]|nr:VOC family protein [Pseudolabrys sp.]
MIDHVSVPVRDLAAAIRFYEAVLGALGMTRLETRPATVGFGKKYPEFWINLRADMAAVEAQSGARTGAHVCFRAREPAIVDAFHAAAVAAGGTSDGAPGLRPQHGEGYYAAFIRDPDGNRVEAVTFVGQT